jgi:uncharacterized protein (DUF342 family)
MNISLYHNFSDKKCAIVERFNRTLMSKLSKYMHSKNTKRYVDVLQDLVDSYNHSYHRTIGTKPVLVEKANDFQVWLNIHKDIIKRKWKKRTNLKENDFVRIRNKKDIFTKGYLAKFTDDVYKIEKVIPSNPFTFKISTSDNTPVSGIFYESELSKVLL